MQKRGANPPTKFFTEGLSPQKQQGTNIERYKFSNVKFLHESSRYYEHIRVHVNNNTRTQSGKFNMTKN